MSYNGKSASIPLTQHAYKVSVTPQNNYDTNMLTNWSVCSREPACHNLSQCHNGTASVDRVVCFVGVYSELVCLHSVKFCVYETTCSLRTFDVKGNGQGGVDQIYIVA